ncbi:hypothetical protein Hbl1158_02765 [Halobaculum sp. CBA1158]|uniref:hypothetical protein n=1 Tax=Halobaculum sp. CBA1158 TaxID=2904243 RepID=UPI001F19F7C2|nr:hypothetical protein [Halobaculum sp. CBA1158]UIP00310.1 hypothetical protein Hbl1158_02765 [Halobaculum sp. CBA1158]
MSGCRNCGSPTSNRLCRPCERDARASEGSLVDAPPELLECELSWTGIKAPSQEGNTVLPDWQPLIDRRGDRA